MSPDFCGGLAAWWRCDRVIGTVQVLGTNIPVDAARTDRKLQDSVKVGMLGVLQFEATLRDDGNIDWVYKDPLTGVMQAPLLLTRTAG